MVGINPKSAQLDEMIDDLSLRRRALSGPSDDTSELWPPERPLSRMT